MSSWTTVRVPASSANLGPGFDALGLALGIYLQCRFRPAPELSIRVTGRDTACISTGAGNLIAHCRIESSAAQTLAIDPAANVVLQGNLLDQGH